MADNSNTPNVYQGGAGAQGTVWSSLDNDTIRVDPEIEKKLRRIRPGKTPFMSLLDNVNKTQGSKQFTFQWMEEWPIQMDCKAVSGNATTSAATTSTALVVDNTTFIKKGYILYNPLTSERIYVVSVTNATTLVITRGYGSTSAIIAPGTTLIVLGQATEEAQDKGDMLMRGTDSGELYLQEISHWVGLSTWEIAVAKRGVNEKSRIDQQAFETFRQWQEHAALFGAPGKHTGPNSRTIFTTAGLDWFCRQKNVANANRALTYDTLDAFCGRVWEYGDNDVRYGFASLQALRKISQFPEVRQTIQRKEESKSVGFEIKEVFGTGGWTLRLVHLPALDRPGLTNRLYVTAMGDLRKRTLDGKSGIYTDKNVQTPGSKRKEWGMSTIFGLEHLNTMACGVLENI